MSLKAVPFFTSISYVTVSSEIESAVLIVCDGTQEAVLRLCMRRMAVVCEWWEQRFAEHKSNSSRELGVDAQIGRSKLLAVELGTETLVTNK